MYLLLMILPIFNIVFLTRYIGDYWGPRLSIFNQVIMTLIGYVIFYEVVLGHASVNIHLWTVLDLPSTKISIDLIFDSLSAYLLIPILTISTLVQLYSLSYLHGDAHINRFYLYLSLFTFAMLVLVTSDNIVILFFGWELVGMVSYLLIHYWYTKVSGNMAALKAIFINRVGDWGLILGMMTLTLYISSLNFTTLFAISYNLNKEVLTLIIFFMLIAASAKSAQFTLHTWLTDAMLAPTPVSALLHSATMVTVGVYLIMRLGPVVESLEGISSIIVILGGVTAVLGSASALITYDIKKIIAYSTCSQLGYMFVACGISQFDLGLFHLINHAFFKSLLFLASGSIIHAMWDEQDIRKYGGLIKILPYSYLSILLASMSLLAFPFFTGYYSKDLILECLLVPNNITNSLGFVLTYLGAILSSVYSIRVLIITYLGKPSHSISPRKLGRDSNKSILVLLSVLSVVLGYLTKELVLKSSPDLLEVHFIESSVNLPLLLIGLLLMLVPILAKYSGLIIMPEFIISMSTFIGDRLVSLGRVLMSINIVNNNIVEGYNKIGGLMYRYLDQGVLQVLGPYGMFKLIHYIGFRMEILPVNNLIKFIEVILITAGYVILWCMLGNIYGMIVLLVGVLVVYL